MKLIIAIVKPFKLDEIRQKLADIGVSGITISEVKGMDAKKVRPKSTESEYEVHLCLNSDGNCYRRRHGCTCQRSYC